jgi:TatD DNase family protein
MADDEHFLNAASPGVVVDALVHLDDSRIGDIDAWLREASRYGVGDVLWAGTDPLHDPRCGATHATPSRVKAPLSLVRASDSEHIDGATRSHPEVRVWHALGLHPRWVDAAKLDDQLEVFSHALKRGGPDGQPWRAVGEIGLDGRNDSPAPELQERAFVTQLDAANSDGFPVVVHCVQRIGRLTELLDEHGGAKHGGVMHSFGGPADMVPCLSDMGMTFSFGGLLLNEHATRSHEAARAVPDDRLLVESDAPDLALDQWPRLMETLAMLRDTTPEAIAEQTAANARRVLRMATLSTTK